MMRRLFAVWPPGWALAWCGIVYLIFQGICIYHEFALRAPFFSSRDAKEALLGILTIFTALYAAYRVAAFHPAVRPGYREWLCGTPWTSKKPLPLGPVHLVWQDLLLLAAAFALAWPRAEWKSVAVLQSFALAYLLTLGFLHLFTGQKIWGYAVLIGLGLMILFARDLPVFFGAAVTTYVLSYIGLRAALAGFPWLQSVALKKTVQTLKKVGQNALKDDKSLGWPYDRLGPRLHDDIILAWDVQWVFGALMGWWFFVGHYQMRLEGDDAGGYPIYFAFLVGGIVVRICAYCNGYLPPLSLSGRLVTGRWIIPGYDQVFAAPLLALAVGTAAWYAPGWLEMPPIYITSAALVLTWWIFWAMPPSLKTWRLTGNHRITMGVITSVHQK